MSTTHSHTEPERYIGLMSGTSLDGVDAVLTEHDPDGLPRVAGRSHVAYPTTVRQKLLKLNQSGPDELHEAALMAQELAILSARAVNTLLQQANLQAADITAIGAHGQTVRHRPELGYTIQLNAPATLAELTHISVIADFRSRDMAAGGQGAPLVPAFHAALFKRHMPCVILNLGGIANVSILQHELPAWGFDTGPANMLMDAWCEKHTGKPYDDQGAWGATGQTNTALLAQLISSQPWLAQAAPKSTGRDMFNMAWLEAELRRFPEALSAQDVQATLQYLTAQTIMDALAQANVTEVKIYVCGGGANNARLLNILRQLGASQVELTDALGIPAQDVEAVAFAWLAWQHMHRRPGNLPAATGAHGPRMLGALWPA